MKAEKIGKRWYTVKGDGVNAEVTAHEHTIWVKPSGGKKPYFKHTHRITITGKGARRDREKIARLLLETFRDDFPRGITYQEGV